MNTKDIVKLLILAFLIIVLAIGFSFLFGEKGVSLMESLKNVWRFGR